MPGLGGAETPEILARKETRDRIGAVLIFSAGTPRGNDARTTRGRESEGRIIVRAHRIFCGHHLFRIRRPEAENIRHPETVETFALGKRPDARQGRIELVFVGGAWIEPDPQDKIFAEQGIPAMNQTIAMPPVGREVTLVVQGRS